LTLPEMLPLTPAQPTAANSAIVDRIIAPCRNAWCILTSMVNKSFE
jgi:hypothetical protein